MSSGRPLSDFDLPKGWRDIIIEEYSKGASDVEIKSIIYSMRGSFSNDLWDRWLRDEPHFSETIKIGKILSESWWNKNGRINLDNRDFSYTGWYMNMKNRFGWRDKESVENNLSEYLSILKHALQPIPEAARDDKQGERKD